MEEIGPPARRRTGSGARLRRTHDPAAPAGFQRSVDVRAHHGRESRPSEQVRAVPHEQRQRCRMRIAVRRNHIFYPAGICRDEAGKNRFRLRRQRCHRVELRAAQRNRRLRKGRPGIGLPCAGAGSRLTTEAGGPALVVLRAIRHRGHPNSQQGGRREQRQKREKNGQQGAHGGQCAIKSRGREPIFP